MVTCLSDILQIAVECVTSLGPRRQFICGWVMTPRGVPLDLRLRGDGGQDLRPSLRLVYVRPDVAPADADAAVVTGFTLVLDGVADTAPLELVLAAGASGGRVNLRDAAISGDLHGVIGAQDGRINFRLLRAAQERAEVLPLLSHQYRPHGAFAGWIARLPLVRHRAEKLGLLADIQAVASPAGEVGLGLAFIGRPARRMQIEPVAIAALRADDGGPDAWRLLPLVDRIDHQGASFAACYGRVPSDTLPRLRGLEIIAQVTFDEEVFWLRCLPAARTVPGFLDGIAAMPGDRMQPGFAAAWLDKVLASREAALKPELDRLAGMAPSPTATAGLAVIVGVDDPLCIPLLEVLADRMEARCEALVMIGKRADQAVQVFQRRGRLPASSGGDAAEALEQAAGCHASVIPLDPLRLGQAAIDGALDALFDQRLQGSELLLLRGLHAAAGCSADLADSLHRLIRLRAGDSQAWQPPQHGWASPVAAHPVNAHLERLWTLPARATANPA